MRGLGYLFGLAIVSNFEVPGSAHGVFESVLTLLNQDRGRDVGPQRNGQQELAASGLDIPSLAAGGIAGRAVLTLEASSNPGIGDLLVGVESVQHLAELGLVRWLG